MTTQEILQGVHDWTNGKIVYDISVAHPDGQGNPTPYADLTTALGNGGANIPKPLRKGGMSVRFIQGSAQSSDNNSSQYVQCRYMGTSTDTADFTNPANWQGVDYEPTAGSKNLIASGGIIAATVKNQNYYTISGTYFRASTGAYASLSGGYSTNLIPISANRHIELYTYLGGSTYPNYGIAFFNANHGFISGYTGTSAGMQKVVLTDSDIPATAVYFTAMLPNGNNLDKAYIYNGFEGRQLATNNYLEEKAKKETSVAQQYVSGISNMSLLYGDLKDTYISKDNTKSLTYIVIKVNGEDIIEIGSSISGAKIAIVSDFDAPKVYPYDYIFATGESSVKATQNGYSATLPIDAKYILMRATNGSTNYIPSSFKINGYDIADNLINKLNSIDNAIDTIKESISSLITDSGTAIPFVIREGYWKSSLGYSNAGGFKRTEKIPVKKGDTITSNTTFAYPYDTVANLMFNTSGTAIDVLPFTNGKCVIDDTLWNAGVRFVAFSFKLENTPNPSVVVKRGIEDYLNDRDEHPTLESGKFVDGRGIESRIRLDNTHIQINLLGLGKTTQMPGNLESTYISADKTRSYTPIRINGGEHIVASSSALGAFAYVKSYDFNLTAPCKYDFATGETTYHPLASGYEGDAPSDAKWILLKSERDGESVLPASFKIDGYDIVKSLRENVVEQIPNILPIENIIKQLHNDSKFAYKGAAPAAFRNKLMMMEDDLNILLLGDSQTAFTDVGEEFDNAANLPPGCQHNGITYKLWNSISKVKPQCDRFDSEVNTFTENGTFSDSTYEKQSTQDNIFGEFSRDNCVYRETSIANDSISFDWSLDDFEKLNFIGRMAPDGSKVVTISCESGKVVVVHNNRMNPKDGYTDGQLVEANGYTFTQWLDSTGQYSAHWLRNMPIKLKRVSGATGTITITITNTTDGNGGTMYYWGTERWNFNTVHVVNIGRGGRNTSLLYKSVALELRYRDVDLLIYQLPLWNDIKGGGNVVPGVNTYYDSILSRIKNESKVNDTDWQRFQMIVNIYHTQAASWIGNNSIQFQANGLPDRPKTDLPDWITCHQIFKHTLESNNEYVVSCDLYNEAFNYANANGLTMQQLLSASSSNNNADDSSGLDSDKFTVDGTHLSSYGFEFYAELIEAMMCK